MFGRYLLAAIAACRRNTMPNRNLYMMIMLACVIDVQFALLMPPLVHHQWAFHPLSGQIRLSFAQKTKRTEGKWKTKKKNNNERRNEQNGIGIDQ